MQPALTSGIKKKELGKTLYKSKNFTIKNVEETNNDHPFAMVTGVQQSVELSPQVKINTKSVKKSNAKQEYTIMTLFKLLGTAYQCLTSYRCAEAIKLFKQLPKSQYNTAWTLVQVGRALFESIRYLESEKVYKEAFAIEPYRVEGMEYYSSCLWHLKKQVDLCELSNRALGITTFAPEVWCVLGNTFSLQKEHEAALKFFSRAVQLNPYFAYAHTLSGHEYVANENFDQATTCYQKAMSCDEKHYNAFWGMGNIYLKQEKYSQAIQYFKRAIGINSKSSVLHTYLGMAYFRNRQSQEALASFEISDAMDPNNPLNKYQKATVLISLGQYENALKVLEELKQKLPKEAPIHVLIGKVCLKLGNKDRALIHFNMAMDLNPKEANLIKTLIDRMERNLSDDNEF